MKPIITTRSFILALVAGSAICHAQAQDLEWAKQLTSAERISGATIAVDGSGYVYTTGAFQGTADLDPGSGTLD